MDVGISFIDFLLQHDMAQAAKNIKKNQWFFNHFHFLVVGLLERFYDRFLVDLGAIWRSKIDQLSVKKVIKNEMRFCIDFGWLLDRFWSDFGPKLGGKMGPSWQQNLKNGSPKTMSKNEL